MQVRYLKNKDINRTRWDLAVDQSPSGLPYAYSWYLETLVGNQWDGLVFGDYDLVMPLPWNRKLFGIPQLFQPPFCQQLGVFGVEEKQALPTFIEAIPQRFQYVLLSLATVNSNWEEWSIDGTFRTKENLILSLDYSYEELSSNFSKSLRKRIRKAKGQLSLESSEDVNGLIQFYQKELAGKVGLTSDRCQRLALLFSTLLDKNMAEIYVVKTPNQQICCQGLFLKTKHRIINLFGASNDLGRKLFAMHFLLAKVLERHANQAINFDFEGSEIPGVANFFKSFGPQSAPFLEYKRDHLPTLLSRIKERRF
ncbi:MAG: hypothetical protein Sapg2KO_19660 [Saprospiraceae bacterium]